MELRSYESYHHEGQKEEGQVVLEGEVGQEVSTLLTDIDTDVAEVFGAVDVDPP